MSPCRSPPLRDRLNDIPELARFFVAGFIKENALPPVELPQATLEWLQTLAWPGNVRELKNALQTGIILCHNHQILPEDLQLDHSPGSDGGAGEGDFSMEMSEKEAIVRALRETKGIKKDAADLLGISRRAMQYKSKKYNLDAADFKS